MLIAGAPRLLCIIYAFLPLEFLIGYTRLRLCCIIAQCVGLESHLAQSTGYIDFFNIRRNSQRSMKLCSQLQSVSKNATLKIHLL